MFEFTTVYIFIQPKFLKSPSCLNVSFDLRTDRYKQQAKGLIISNIWNPFRESACHGFVVQVAVFARAFMLMLGGLGLKQRRDSVGFRSHVVPATSHTQL